MDFSELAYPIRNQPQTQGKTQLRWLLSSYARGRSMKGTTVVGAVMCAVFLAGCSIQVRDGYKTNPTAWDFVAMASALPSWEEYGIPVLAYMQIEGSPYDLTVFLPKSNSEGRPFVRWRLDSISFYTEECGWADMLTSRTEERFVDGVAPLHLDEGRGTLSGVQSSPICILSDVKMVVGCGPEARRKLNSVVNVESAANLWVVDAKLAYIGVRYAAASTDESGNLVWERRQDVVPLKRKRAIYPLPGIPYWRHGP